MTISNEPGYYEPFGFGIRIENLYITKFVETPNNFGGKKYLGFEPATLVPIKTNMINVDQLDEHELNWLNEYHRQVREALLPGMQKHFPESVEYLLNETRSLARK
jgi:Xaa-Pro aminopeptidase